MKKGPGSNKVECLRRGSKSSLAPFSFRFRDDLAPQRSGRAGPVVDYELLTQRFAELLTEEPDDRV